MFSESTIHKIKKSKTLDKTLLTNIFFSDILRKIKFRRNY